MLDQKRVQEAIGRVDGLLGRAKIIDPVLTRQDHIILVNDLQIIQQCCKDYFDDEKELKEKKDVGTDKPTECTEPCDPNF